MTPEPAECTKPRCILQSPSSLWGLVCLLYANMPLYVCMPLRTDVWALGGTRKTILLTITTVLRASCRVMHLISHSSRLPSIVSHR